MIKNIKNQDIFYGYEYDVLSLDKVDIIPFTAITHPV